MTKKGIEKNLKITPYVYQTETAIYYFSSRFYMDKFINEYEKYRITFNIEFKAKYGIKTDFKIIPDLVLYKKIEKRGYFVRLNGSELECPEMVWFGEMVKY